MKRNYISPEFNYQSVYGTYNMLEQCSFLGSKMMDIEEKVNIEKDNLVYYQQSNGEQLDLISESGSSPIVYDQSLDKSKNHTINLVDLQSDFLKNGNANWSIVVDLKTIFINTLFATLKKYRSFEGLQNLMTRDNDVNSAIINYINLNIRSRYKFSKIELFIEYFELISNEALKYGNIYEPTIQSEKNKFTKFQSETAFDDSQVKIIFSQEKSASEFAFKYYFNIYFEKL